MAWILGFRTRPGLDAARARSEAEGRLAGFRAAEIVLADDASGAVLRGVDGSVGLLLPLGDGWIARRLPVSALSWSGAGVTARLDEPMLRTAVLPLAVKPLWLEAAA
ncbi:hypothetical protein FJQ54_10605 [Sandaracinobacter neustonicus]|uniref:Uncharacterized protein n=1 Tax=Sandaracinobacter neustonicus TaxID=1715348 RepID=A0A501XIJ8_9SPHN|nr:hypothetical protein [Sandaracinobacter neustonicus]TPE60452.1 hypothetical protein FJQ54_10605 [Sandaracinobacter neustonicus]